VSEEKDKKAIAFSRKMEENLKLTKDKPIITNGNLMGKLKNFDPNLEIIFKGNVLGQWHSDWVDEGIESIEETGKFLVIKIG